MKLGRLLLGVAIGAVVALLIAPKKGDELREDMKNLWGEISEGEKEPVSAVKDFFGKVMPSGEEKEKVVAGKTISPTEV